MSPFKARLTHYEKKFEINIFYDRYKGKLKCNQFYSTISKAIPIQGSTPQMTSMVLHSRYAYYNTTLIKVSPTYFLQLLLLHAF